MCVLHIWLGVGVGKLETAIRTTVRQYTVETDNGTTGTVTTLTMEEVCIRDTRTRVLVRDL